MLKKESSAQPIDELRYNMYHKVKPITLDNLPPPSHSTKGNILKALYLIFLMINCLTNINEPDPHQYGYEIADAMIVPMIFHLLISDDLIPNCTTCTTCVRKTCPWRSQIVTCPLCSCRKSQTCDSVQCAKY